MIVVIALLLAIFISVMGTARERGQRAVCLSNLRHLTLAWVAYADQNDGNLVSGSADAVLAIGRLTLNGWAGQAFTVAQSRSALIHDPRKGPLWPYLNDIDIYRCARGREGHALTYSIVAGAKATR